MRDIETEPIHGHSGYDLSIYLLFKAVVGSFMVVSLIWPMQMILIVVVVNSLFLFLSPLVYS